MTDDAVRGEIALAQAAIQRVLDLLPDREQALAEANARTEAVQIVLAAAISCQGWRGLDRQKFRGLITEASRLVPNTGPRSVQHAVLLAESRKVLESGSDRP
ncbi:ATP-dependent helicase [Methylobacterium sp. E-065]|uniref:ATP-dependent helicase n=1 Tax=Methylobacterium sp. E-065 TaxID=2836583 RepID=UPI001FBBFB5A|nr:ATP-dependent helicase [Methylobacterium sp. E-065]MCJ2020736.1 ATP-dependent helicase [Methylobacterium sp. E-065]